MIDEVLAKVIQAASNLFLEIVHAADTFSLDFFVVSRDLLTRGS